MKVINIVNALKNDQYLEVTNDPSNPLRCVDKPEFICLFSQALEFAKVLGVVQQNLILLDIRKVETAKEKLNDRYTHFIQKHSSWALMLTSLFLWILGYRGENSLESMATKMQPRFDLITHETLHTDEEIKIISSKCSHLKVITLGETVTAEGLKLIAENCHQLESITFDGLSSISSEQYQSFLQSCPTIRKISLANGKDEIAKILIQNCPQLTELVLGGQITDDTLECAAKNCPLLTNVRFIGCDKITFKDVQNLIEKCPKINCLGILFCHKISDEQEVQLKQLIENRTGS